MARLRDAGVDAFGVPLDVTDDVGVATGGAGQQPSTVDLAALGAAVETNVIGVVRVTDALLLLLRRSAAPRVVNVSSTVGSLTRQSSPSEETGPVSGAYALSTTFLNAVTVQYATELQGTGILVNAGCPGFTATDLNAFRGVRTPQQGAAIAITLATLPDDGPSGGFFDDDGVIPWLSPRDRRGQEWPFRSVMMYRGQRRRPGCRAAPWRTAW